MNGRHVKIHLLTLTSLFKGEVLIYYFSKSEAPDLVSDQDEQNYSFQGRR